MFVYIDFNFFYKVHPNTNDFKSSSWTLSFTDKNLEFEKKSIIMFVENDNIPEENEIFVLVTTILKF